MYRGAQACVYVKIPTNNCIKRVSAMWSSLPYNDFASCFVRCCTVFVSPRIVRC